MTGWYKKAVDLSLGTHIKNTFVSTNSICQGSQVITFWRYLIERFGIHIDFAYKTFVWDNTDNQAKVHCVIRRKYIPMGFMNKGEVLGTPAMKAAYTAGNKIR